jgi:hypothetical protein
MDCLGNQGNLDWMDLRETAVFRASLDRKETLAVLVYQGRRVNQAYQA